MLDIVSYFTAEGYLLGKLTPKIPQYKMTKVAGKADQWAAFELTSNGTYEQLGTPGPYEDSVRNIVARATNINRKKIQRVWRASTKPDIAAYAANGTPTDFTPMIVWSIQKSEDYPDLYQVMYHDGISAPTPIYCDCLFGCQMFVKEPMDAIIERLVELYNMHRGLGLYKMVSNLYVYQTVEMCSRSTLYEVVRTAINYSPSWVRRAVRIGTRFIQPDGRSTNLEKTGVYDWNVTQLSGLMQLEDGEIKFLFDRDLISSIMNGADVCQVVRDYLQDPDHKLRREYLESCGR